MCTVACSRLSPKPDEIALPAGCTDHGTGSARTSTNPFFPDRRRHDHRGQPSGWAGLGWQTVTPRRVDPISYRLTDAGLARLAGPIANEPDPISDALRRKSARRRMRSSSATWRSGPQRARIEAANAAIDDLNRAVERDQAIVGWGFWPPWSRQTDGKSSNFSPDES